ncbi:hypothetical protein HYN59_10960 [Flavobacterium album]|uniref:Uncharacterized protein n=1 Tax=Flavobacterium album TaxID=2175091 RepID=A0A2S1QYV1_9FLAO|nr:hypothetical protein [Flavobacterium album]AWH85596.1 hypothetical protein HYN59_10960 [Flavobacterium album]
MPDLTYTVEGTFSTTKIKLSAKLPRLGAHESYSFPEFHNISKTTATGQINAILIYMTRSNENGMALLWNSATDPLVPLPNITPTTAMVRHALAPVFDWNVNDILIILFHEPKTQADIDAIQNETDTLYNTVKVSGAFSTTWLAHAIEKGNDKSVPENTGLNKIWDLFDPRKAGMTIISKPKP